MGFKIPEIKHQGKENENKPIQQETEVTFILNLLLKPNAEEEPGDHWLCRQGLSSLLLGLHLDALIACCYSYRADNCLPYPPSAASPSSETLQGKKGGGAGPAPTTAESTEAAVTAVWSQGREKGPQGTGDHVALGLLGVGTGCAGHFNSPAPEQAACGKPRSSR